MFIWSNKQKTAFETAYIINIPQNKWFVKSSYFEGFEYISPLKIISLCKSSIDVQLLQDTLRIVHPYMREYV